MKKWIYCLAISLGLSFLFINNSFAASDIVVDVDSSFINNPPASICNNSGDVACSSYRYFYVTCATPPPGGYIGTSITLSDNGSNSTYSIATRIYPTFSPVFSISENHTLTNFGITSNNSMQASFSCQLVLSENNPSSSSSPVPEPSEPCEDPEENSRFMQVVLDSFWKYHVAFASAVPALIVIFLVYRLLKNRIR